MAKKNSGVKFIIHLIIFGVFFYYEYGLYKKYIQDKIIRDRVREEKTREIEKAFLLRDKDFYLDRDYERKLKDLKSKQMIEKSSLSKGDEIIGQ